MPQRSNVLADRLEQGARDLANFANGLSDVEWSTPIPHDGRKIGTVVHHVASVYPIEVQLAQKLAGGQPVVGMTMDDIHAMNAGHARENASPSKAATLELLKRNSSAAASAIRALSDADLDRGFPVSLYSDAPLTCQFALEDHAVRHSYHHLAAIRRTLKK